MSEDKGISSGPSAHNTIFVEWFMAAVALCLIIARGYVRFSRLRQKPILSDYLVVISFICCVGHITCDTLLGQYGLLDPYHTFRNATFPNNPESVVAILKIFYAAEFPFHSALYFNKFSILAFIHTIFPPALRSLRIALYVVIGINIASYITTTLLEAFYCEPIADNWSLEPGVCVLLSAENITILLWALNVFSDVLVFCLPFLVFQKLAKLPLREVIGLIVVFSLGLITIAITITRFIINLEKTTAITSVAIWSSMDPIVGLIVACLPSLKPLLQSKTSRKNKLGSNSSEMPIYNDGTEGLTNATGSGANKETC